MAIIHIKKESNFTVLSNEILQSKDLSFGAKGLLCELLSLPDDWVVYKDALIRESCGRTKLNGFIEELKKESYMEIKRIRNEKGIIVRNEWVISEKCTKPTENHRKSVDSPNDGKTERRKNRTPDNQHLQRTIYNKELYKQKTIKTYIEHFERWYEIYPIGKGKQKAYASFVKQIDKCGRDVEEFTEVLINEVRLQITERDLKQRHNVWCPEWKHPSTWLNGACWNDKVCINEKEIQNASEANTTRRMDGLDHAQSIERDYGLRAGK